MSNIRYKNNILFIENVSVKRLASQYKSPFYLYSKTTILSKIIDHFSIILEKLIL